MSTVRSADPDALAALEEERDFLLRSLDDLEREYAAGDVDEHDYRTLRDDYTARAAGVLRAIEEGRAAFDDTPPPPRGRRLATVLGVVAIAVLAGVLVAQASGRRTGGGLTGLDVTAASQRIGDCQMMERSEGPQASLDCYTEILDSLPANVEALTYRGWLQVRSFDVQDGITDLDAAIQLAPDASAPRIFRASARSRSGDPAGAIADLAAFYANDPSDQERTIAQQFGTAIIQRALDGCIQGDVSGDLPVVEVLQCYRDVLAVDDGNATASIYLGWLLARSGVDDQRALRLLDAGLDADPSLTAGYVFRAALRAHLGDVEGARTDLATFAGRDTPADEATAADAVRSAIDAGEDPLAR